MLTNWNSYIIQERERVGDYSPTTHCTLTDEELLIDFESGFGGVEGTPFVMFTEERVYFATCYDGAEWVSSMPLKPEYIIDRDLRHVGG